MWRTFSSGFPLLVVVGALVSSCVFVRTADARRNYERAFEKKYENVAKANRIACTVCHEADNKKQRNNYGRALSEALGDKKVNDKARIDAAFRAAEKEESAIPGKTFGDLLEDGKLPASKK